MSIRELFRQKLGNTEIIPDAEVKSGLMRKLARREFLRFNPARFNIYYLGGILVAVISAAIIIYSGREKSDHLIPLNDSGEKVKTDTIHYIGIPVEQSEIQNSDKFGGHIVESPNIQREIRSVVKSKNEDHLKNVSRETPVINPSNVIDSFSKTGIFPEASPNMNKLRGSGKSEAVLFESSAVEGCSPLKLHFSIISDSYDSCRWTFGDGGYSFEKNPEWMFDVEGEYKVILQLFASDGSLTTSSTIITVHPKPLARFEIAPEKALLPEDEIRFYNYSINAVNFKWDFGDGSSSLLFEPRHRYSKFDNYNVGLVVSSDYGCSDSLVVLNAFSGSVYFIDFPNAFIPNIQGPTGGYYSSKSDETAQVFHPVSSGVSDFQLKIFSKLGILIFESNDVNLGWDGYFKGQLCDPGVYIWKVRGSYRNGEPFIKMGDITVLRN